MIHPEPSQRPSHDLSGSFGWDDAVRRGDFAAAFRASDSVLDGRRPGDRDDPALPYHERWVWDGTAPDGRSVLVRCYHGLGDTLQFCRFLPALRRRARRVTLEVQPPLMPLMRQFGLDLHPFDPARPLKLAECDVEIMELAHALRMPPDPMPYLSAPARPGPRGRVGFCWEGGGWDGERDVPPALLAPLLALPGLRPVSLQRGAAAAALPLPDPLGGSMALDALAALVAGLDAVVTVDTMVAHLAGALGRPVLLLLKHRPDWRWGTEGAWYGSVRQFEQPAPGDWAGAFARLLPALAATLAVPEGLNVP